MEHEMKISPSTVRRLRIERGWSQDQLAVASGLSLRTIQRVEADGITSMSSAVSLAATYEVKLLDLQGETKVHPPLKHWFNHVALFLGGAVITLAIMLYGLRTQVHALGSIYTTIDILVLLFGVILMLPALLRLVAQRQFMGISLALLGTPLVTLLSGGLVFSVVDGRYPTWPLIIMGTAGVVLNAMALREFNRARPEANV